MRRIIANFWYILSKIRIIIDERCYFLYTKEEKTVPEGADLVFIALRAAYKLPQV